MSRTDNRQEQNVELQRSLEDLDRSIWFKEDLDEVLVAIDVFASCLASALDRQISDDESQASAFFRGLVPMGLDPHAADTAGNIERISSMNLYDDDERLESKIEEAEKSRSELYSYLRAFIQSLPPKRRGDK